MADKQQVTVSISDDMQKIYAVMSEIKHEIERLEQRIRRGPRKDQWIIGMVVGSKIKALSKMMVYLSLEFEQQWRKAVENTHG